jgi:hypothetical protein
MKTSRFKGVYWDKYHQWWSACLEHDGKKKVFRNLSDELAAAEMYNKTALQVFGSYAYLNDISIKEK